jgi:hypothetical protein
MSVSTLMRRVERVKLGLQEMRTPKPSPLLEAIRKDPSQIMVRAGMQPDEFQTRILRSHSARFLLCASRQVGKTEVASSLALHTMLTIPRSLVLVLSPTERQSAELLKDKIYPLYAALGRPVAAAQESALSLTLVNQSRLVALPGE